MYSKNIGFSSQSVFVLVSYNIRAVFPYDFLSTLYDAPFYIIKYCNTAVNLYMVPTHSLHLLMRACEDYKI